MNHGSLFSGIGGFDLASSWMGWNNVFHCEINPFGQKILQYYWPNAISYSDITTTDFSIHRGHIDILTGGFPCQPFSLAGKRKGTEDERHLWPQMLRAIQQIQPTWVVGENVFGIINWSDGLVFEQVQADLEAAGYEVQPYVLPACAVNAPHRRDRVWFVARRRWDERTSPHHYRDGYELRGLGKDRSAHGKSLSQFEQRQQVWNDNRGDGEPGIVADTDKFNGDISGLRAGEIPQLKASRILEDITSDTKSTGRERPIRAGKSIRFESGTWDNWPTIEPTIRSNYDGLPSRLDGITVSKHRNESIKAYGNAIVPQVAYQIFKSIEQYEQTVTI